MRVAPLIQWLIDACTSKRFSGPLARPVPALVAGALLLFCSHPTFGQCTIACRSSLNIALSTTGQAEITPEFLLTDPDCDPADFSVDVTDGSGNSLGNILNCTHIGQALTATVTHIASGNNCSTTLQVADNLAPWLTCADTIVFCSVSTDPQLLGYPSVQDNCTAFDSTSLNYSDSFIDLACYSTHNGDSITSKIERSWTAVDESGNQSTCLQTIYLKRATVEDVVFPLHRDGFVEPALDCQDDPLDLNLTGRPTVAGYPLEGGGPCELVASYTDQTVAICGPASYRILRRWTVIDYCSGDFKDHIQLIKLEDTTAPTFSCPADITVGVEYDECTAVVNLPTTTATDDCSNVSITPGWTYGSGYGPFVDVPLGIHIVTYTAEDDCGNTSNCQMTVTVIDNVSPVVICDQSTQISLASNGLSTIPAATFDDGSFDNCGIDLIEVGRDGIQYGPFIEFNCADVAQSPVMIYLRVMDEAGNYNECTVEATIQDNTAPLLICPADTSLLCHQDYTDLQISGQPTLIEACQLDTLYYTDQLDLNSCQVGVVYRTWTAIDAHANQAVCTQTITLIDTTPVEVVFPEDIDFYDCGANADPANTGLPTFINDDCESMYHSYTDQLFNFGPPACYKIFREWEVIDWCVYDPNGNGEGLWTHTQVISIFDTLAPVISCPADVIVGNIATDCGAVSIMIDPATASDCSDALTISNDSPYALNSGADASGVYPTGTHIITFTATDDCGNSSTCTMELQVVDAKAPSPQCIAGVVINLSTDGTVTIDPATIDNGSDDNCTASIDLQLEVSPATFTCDDIGEQLVELIVTDEAGNTAVCTAVVTIQDNQGHCPFANLSGSVVTETGQPVNKVSLLLSGAALDTVRTDVNGSYLFKDVLLGEDYDITPSKDSFITNGLSSFDLLLISRHILGISSLSSPYKMIAADANKSGHITTFDIVLIRKLILHISTNLPGNQSWRFVDADFVFENPANPFATTFPESISLEGLSQAKQDLNFIAIKVGDINGSANTQAFSEQGSGRSKGSPLLLQTPDRDMLAGEIYNVLFSASQVEQLRGFQFALDIDPDLIAVESFVKEAGQLMKEQNFGQDKLEQGMLTASWIAKGLEDEVKEGAALFKLRLRARQNVRLSEAISLSSGYTRAEAYRETARDDFSFVPVELQHPDVPVQQAKEGLALYQNYPNPFRSHTVIQIESADRQKVEFSIFDTAGRLKYSTRLELQRGRNELRLEQSALQLSAGCYLYQVISDKGQRSSREMVTQ